MNLTEYYLKQSKRSFISSNFANRFDNTPQKIMEKVRHLYFSPCETPKCFGSENWPCFLNMSDIEDELKTQKIIACKPREFSLTCVAVMREKGIPSRCRCGFASYLGSGFYEDHWVVEYFDNGWKLSDPQMCKYELQTGEFINGAIAWELARKMGFNTNFFGARKMQKEEDNRGIYYLVVNLFRDMSALIKKELEYPEIISDLMNKNYRYTKKDFLFLDRLSQLILNSSINDLENIFTSSANGSIIWQKW